MIKKLKILEVVFSTSWGGLEINACNFSKNILGLGHNVYFAAPDNTKISEFCENNNIPFFPVDPTLKYLSIGTAIKLSKIIKKTGSDILHLHISKDISTSILAKKLSKTAKIVFTQHMDSRYPKKDIFHRWIYRNTDMIVTVTKEVKENVLKHSSASLNQVSCIYNGVDREKFWPLDSARNREKYNIETSRKVVGMISRLDRLKKQELLVEAAPSVIRKNPDVLFLFVGEETRSKTGSGYKKVLEDIIEMKGLESYFRFIDFTEKITEIYELLDASVLTTPKETFGMVIIEAMAKGVPVIGSNAGGVKEIIEDGVSGYLFEPNDAAGLAEKINMILENEELRTKFRNEGIKRVEKVFDVKKKLLEYERLFYSLISPDKNL
ncbi:glycosyltransferase family 4 protein [candidate division KSB1 bacterium]